MRQDYPPPSVDEDLLAALCQWVAERIHGHHRRRGVAVQLRWTIGAIGGITVGGGTFMLLLRDDQKVALVIEPLDAYGNPAKIDGVPAWAVSDETIGTFAPADDGMSGVFVAGGPLGVCQVSVTIDADLGSGVRSLSGTLDIQVEAGEALTVGITAGVPEPK